MQSKKDRLIFAGVAAQVLVFGSLIGVRLLAQPASHPPPEPRPINADRKIVAGESGSSSKGYWLVEFGDYQCPPCAASSRRVDALLKEHADLRFTFRQFPLQGIHKNAMAAALVAESARSAGKFNKVHSALYGLNADISPENLKQVAIAYDLPAPTNTERNRISHDMSDAQRIKVSGTPTFVLCLPTGKIVALGSLDQARDFIQ